MRSRLLQSAAVSAVFGLLGVACTSDGASETSAPASTRPLIVVTTSILGDVVTNIVADDAEIEILVPPEADGRSYKATVRQETAIRQADAIVWNGLGLELGLKSLFAEVEAEGVTLISAGSDVDPISLDNTPGRLDPAFWMDAQRMARAVTAIADGLGDAHRALDTNGLRSRAAAYSAEVQAADSEAMGTLAGISTEKRIIVTNDDSWSYFGDRYSFEVRTIPGAPMVEPSEQELESLTAELDDAGVRAVFAEANKSTRSARSLAEQTNGQVLTVYSNSLGLPGSGFDTYTKLITANARRVAAGLDGSATTEDESD